MKKKTNQRTLKSLRAAVRQSKATLVQCCKEERKRREGEAFNHVMEARCCACGVAYTGHPGIIATCRELQMFKRRLEMISKTVTSKASLAEKLIRIACLVDWK